MRAIKHYPGATRRLRTWAQGGRQAARQPRPSPGGRGFRL